MDITQNNKAFEEFFRFYYPRLKKYAYYFLKSDQDADDLIQDVFFQLWRNRSKLNDSENIPSYTFTLLRNKCLDFLKRRVVEERYLDQQAFMEAEELYYISFGKSDKFVSMEEQLYLELEKIIQDMPVKCGTAFRLRWIEGKRNREIAAMMNISTTMVDKHLARGLDIARKKLRPELFLFFMLLGKEKFMYN
ncbi:RNA polymerase sigma-70 factor [Sunxiuqinia indica]|uniref:RNA polymerase sigma-70 factor n=1 Tax=Sunxiuqinia indica TaxID=2692584 RepID=UPI00135681FD|nr:RNA polymerase sigma-70 factor [Sunxiuqinia indica]